MRILVVFIEMLIGFYSVSIYNDFIIISFHGDSISNPFIVEGVLDLQNRKNHTIRKDTVLSSVDFKKCY